MNIRSVDCNTHITYLVLVEHIVLLCHVSSVEQYSQGLEEPLEIVDWDPEAC